MNFFLEVHADAKALLELKIRLRDKRNEVDDQKEPLLLTLAFDQVRLVVKAYAEILGGSEKDMKKKDFDSWTAYALSLLKERRICIENEEKILQQLNEDLSMFMKRIVRVKPYSFIPIGNGFGGGSKGRPK